MNIQQSFFDRYLESSRPERNYRFPSKEIVLDPLKVTAGFLGALVVEKMSPVDTGLEDYLEVATMLSGMVTLIGAHAFVSVRNLNQTGRRIEGKRIKD